MGLAAATERVVAEWLRRNGISRAFHSHALRDAGSIIRSTWRYDVDIDRFKQQHVLILQAITRIRKIAQAGIAEHAEDIARELRRLQSTVALHLSVEDKILYPSLQRSQDRDIARMAKAFQDEMKPLADGFVQFVEHWASEQAVRDDPEGFRQGANTVIKALHQRVQRENSEFYPRIEAL
jgi:iron-sulfur cluster repair protein YtfE (RIC family)